MMLEHRYAEENKDQGDDLDITDAETGAVLDSSL